MAFSPETYTILRNILNSLASDLSADESDIATLKEDVSTLKSDDATLKEDVSTLKTTTANRMAKANNPFTSAMLNYLNSSFDAANNNSIVTGSASASTWALAWWGVKSKSTWKNSFIFSSSASGGTAIGIATRDEEGNWSGVAFDLSR